MQLRLKPVYGYGWFGPEGHVEVPPCFCVDAPSRTPDRAEGIVADDGHPLAGMWVVATIRTRGDEPTYNVRAFAKESDEKHQISGFAAVS
jgi:hypothetical protein